jgi:hypothetical protein
MELNRSCSDKKISFRPILVSFKIYKFKKKRKKTNWNVSNESINSL